jgi:hypothetical protein
MVTVTKTIIKNVKTNEMEQVKDTFPEATGLNITQNGDLLIVAPIPGGPPQGGRIMRAYATGTWDDAMAEESMISAPPKGGSGLPGNPLVGKRKRG